MAHHHRVFHRRPEKRLAQLIIDHEKRLADLRPVILKEWWEEVPWAEMQASFIDTYPEGEITDWGWKLDRENQRCWYKHQEFSYPREGFGFNHHYRHYAFNYELALTYTKSCKPDEFLEETTEDGKTVRTDIYYIVWAFYPWSWWRRFPGYGGAWKNK